MTNYSEITAGILRFLDRQDVCEILLKAASDNRQLQERMKLLLSKRRERWENDRRQFWEKILVSALVDSSRSDAVDLADNAVETWGKRFPCPSIEDLI